MKRAKTDLDVSSPDEVADVLLLAAQMYGESAVELTHTWQDRRAGRPWEKLARILERASDESRRAVGDAR